MRTRLKSRELSMCSHTSSSDPFTMAAKRSLEIALNEPSTPTKKNKSATQSLPLTPSGIGGASTSVTLEALATHVSPLKNKRFVGELIDQTTSIKLVGFDHHTQAKLQALSEDKMPILLSNCDVQVNKFTKQLEVVVKRYTQIEAPSRQFHIEEIDNIGAQTITLSQLRSCPQYTRVNIRAKVINIKTPQQVGNNKRKQEIIVADDTDNCVLTIWEEHIDTLGLRLCESYYITKLIVRVFNNDYSLSLPETGSKVTHIDDLDNVKEDIPDMLEPTIEGVSVIAVKDLQQFKACVFCKGKIDTQESGIGTCQKCDAVQKLDKCKINEMAKIVVESPSMEIVTLVAYADILQSILIGEPLNSLNLLSAKPFTVTYNRYNVITSIARSE